MRKFLNEMFSKLKHQDNIHIILNRIRFLIKFDAQIILNDALISSYFNQNPSLSFQTKNCFWAYFSFTEIWKCDEKKEFSQFLLYIFFLWPG